MKFSRKFQLFEIFLVICFLMHPTYENTHDARKTYIWFIMVKISNKRIVFTLIFTVSSMKSEEAIVKKNS